jgi:hypothetical protein
MEPSPSWGAANRAATQELPSILWSPDVQYRAHKSSALVRATLIQSTPSHPISLSSILIVSTHLRLGLPSSLFFWLSHQYSICIPLLPPSCYMPCPSHPPWLDHSTYTWWRVQVTKLLIMQFSAASCHFTPLWSKYSPRHPVLKRSQNGLPRLRKNMLYTVNPSS